ncbi:N-formylglutamate amidohydrolase [Frigidibacter sp. ROC022]|uniref:N-formylglutamate amidohydrolase n=1 Tax=Frigidibacter sp. ROC022 TaxID=2971796 RepID=UPI00215AF147|nr:N-formylglutamate amidohydrolase [Frigidibacter sp. ROC022]MCR8724809.1 N-formylglutamate amidohydrolase [Frigidibacter sp. ROC022]
MSRKPYELREPAERSTSVIFASPHSGRDYAWSFLRRTVLDERSIRSSEDAFVDHLFDHATVCGAPLLAARSPRAFVDLNRAPDELDPALIEDVTRSGHNPRIGSGLGVIPRVVSNGRAIYSGKLTRREADQRLADVWHPYHKALGALLEQNHAKFGQAILIDCHSMPHEAIDNFANAGLPRPEVVLGDRYGASAAPSIVEGIEVAFRRVGFRVTRNAPFAGAYTAQNYGRPSRKQHVIQVEIDRSLYMNEQLIRPNSAFDGFQKALREVIAEIASLGRAMPESLAAE